MKIRIQNPVLNSNNTSGITADNSNILIGNKYHIKKNNKSTSNSKYLNSSIFESKTLDSNIIKNDLYLTELDIKADNSLFTEPNKNEHKMEELFDYKPTLTGKILPSIKKKPPTMIYCCNEKYEAKNLSNLYSTYWVNPKKKKSLIVNHKIERTKVRDSSNEYIEKTKEIILARYNLQIKKEAVERIENNVKNEINNLDQTMNVMKKYKDDLENNFINKYNEALKSLNNQIIEEKIKKDLLSIELGKIHKEVNKLHNIITKVDEMKKGIEKWIIFQIQMQKRKIPFNLKETLKKEYNWGLIFSSPDELEDWFESMKIKNIYLINKYNTKIRERDEIMKNYLEIKKNSENDKWVDNEVIEKKKILELLKLRNEKLEKDKKHAVENKISELKLNKKNHFLLTSQSQKNLFSKVKYIYTHIKDLMSNEVKNVIIDAELSRMSNSDEKIIKMIRSIELVLNYLISKFVEYRLDPKLFNIYKEIKYKMDLEHKKDTANQVQIEEKRKIAILQERLERRNKRFIFVPFRKVENYPFTLYNKKKMNETEENIQHTLTLQDFLYDTK